jgi:nitrite reductase/ring-hydroxylating ferredoxin subunit
VATLALQGSCSGCAASQATLELAIKQALDEHAPDLAGLEVRGVIETAPSPLDGTSLPMADNGQAVGIELPVVHTGASLPLTEERPARWVHVSESARPAAGATRTVTVDGVPLLLADVDGSLLAYADECASCGEPLREGDLDGSMLRCPSCAVEFDLPRAGRAAGGEPLQLRPVPLLEADGLRVAV